jgi:hypothetical protein
MKISEMKKGDQITINSAVNFYDGTWECYNITEGLCHFARIGKKGQKLSWKNKNNLMCLRQREIDALI